MTISHRMYKVISYLTYIFNRLASLSFSFSHRSSSLVQRLHHSVGALPGREQSHGGTHVAGICGRVFHEAVFLPQTVTTF